MENTFHIQYTPGSRLRREDFQPFWLLADAVSALLNSRSERFPFPSRDSVSGTISKLALFGQSVVGGEVCRAAAY